MSQCRCDLDSRSLSRDTKTLVKLQKSGGVVTRSPVTRKNARMQRAREYFYGVRLGVILGT